MTYAIVERLPQIRAPALPMRECRMSSIKGTSHRLVALGPCLALVKAQRDCVDKSCTFITERVD